MRVFIASRRQQALAVRLDGRHLCPGGIERAAEQEDDGASAAKAQQHHGNIFDACSC
jgi:hypothetical protein